MEQREEKKGPGEEGGDADTYALMNRWREQVGHHTQSSPSWLAFSRNFCLGVGFG